MKKIPLDKGKHALVDNKDYETINRFKWYAKNDRGFNWYAYTTTRPAILMHRLILGLKFKDKKQIDHANGNGLDNRRENLRICSHAENQYNRKSGWGASTYKGVSWVNRNQKWLASICHNSKRKYIGIFDSETEAARAYDEKAIELFGGFAKLNLLETRDA